MRRANQPARLKLRSGGNELEHDVPLLLIDAIPGGHRPTDQVDRLAALLGDRIGAHERDPLRIGALVCLCAVIRLVPGMVEPLKQRTG